MMITKDILGFGVADNFAGHAEQAGEYFVCVPNTHTSMPKGLFPFYIPRPYSESFLNRFCIHDNIILPLDSTLKLQAEPEIALMVDVAYEGEYVKSVFPTHFMAFDDTSIRNLKTATKLSEKKNFSIGSKGVGNIIALDKFSKAGMLDDYLLTCFHIRDGVMRVYGENSCVVTYNYFYETLLDWIVDRLNNQPDFDRFYELAPIVQASGFPKRMLIAVGATRYTEFGSSEEGFLREGDTVIVVAYNCIKIPDIQGFIEQNLRIDSPQSLQSLASNDISILVRKVIR
ncbi:MAG: DUF5718 family protein [Helicobacter sp.]|uniref:DUF5718 family protein n=1 Tax=Helicobacter sp. 10-6591 TaxID=2004998 RepID=UPI00215C7CF9|nr:DUF5718 family protein [Helicobacter sp. 10-6591]MCI6218085.1 DUF5718 family protein [Helicobacter sp.]MCI7485440.1 DUF5718 family protein [Helicobacter sp.]MDY5740783.1 DUF5718 family protein [Helicobacter sp.]